ncbi:hypothetical protein CPK_ORF00567 [Chlamydia pneumoniae LPCoLN]|uniref:Uncharacterized protein n=1 Tax=Chlamydia pneumoniae TaxID=83558 RepID=Q9K205_CHLPN|nr:hypothetical protein CP_0712 [Chlamydia pneumoniae AR39]ACZ33037.1 hypothetical protein CPK_ORF00567 [Chlamydia pneumoniae LPCoLN]ETR79936.1 hypothetical protein X556_0737 [Chlamydia pneumoniae B21]
MILVGRAFPPDSSSFQFSLCNYTLSLFLSFSGVPSYFR